MIELYPIARIQSLRFPRGGRRACGVVVVRADRLAHSAGRLSGAGRPERRARTDYRQAILEPELRSALATLNPDAAPAMIDAAVRAVLAVPSQDLLENNRAFHPLLASGIPVEITENGETPHDRIAAARPREPAGQPAAGRQSVHRPGRAGDDPRRYRRFRQRPAAGDPGAEEPGRRAGDARTRLYPAPELQGQGARADALQPGAGDQRRHRGADRLADGRARPLRPVAHDRRRGAGG